MVISWPIKPLHLTLISLRFIRSNELNLRFAHIHHQENVLAEKSINSVLDLLLALADDNTAYSGAIWYRGHADNSWELTPGYFPLNDPPSESTSAVAEYVESDKTLMDNINYEV